MRPSILFALVVFAAPACGWSSGHLHAMTDQPSPIGLPGGALALIDSSARIDASASVPFDDAGADARAPPSDPDLFAVTDVDDFDVDDAAIYAIVGKLGASRRLVRIDRRTHALSELDVFSGLATVDLVGLFKGAPVVEIQSTSGDMSVGFMRYDLALAGPQKIFELTAGERVCGALDSAALYVLTFDYRHAAPYVLTRRPFDGTPATERKNLGHITAKVPTCDGPYISGDNIVIGVGDSITRQLVSLSRSLQGPVREIWLTEGECLGFRGEFEFDGAYLFAAQGASPARVVSVEVRTGNAKTIFAGKTPGCVGLNGVDQRMVYGSWGSYSDSGSLEETDVSWPRSGGAWRKVGKDPPHGKRRGSDFWVMDAEGIRRRELSR